MNRDHLADAPDFWKAACIGFLDGMTTRDKKYALPMLTDAPRWSKTMLDLYAALAGVERKHVLKAKVRYSPRIKSYFDLGSVPDDAVIFVDPDDGIETMHECSERHLPGFGIEKMLDGGNQRILMICQHPSRDPYSIQMALHRALVRGGMGVTCHAFAYDAGVVSMIVVSRDARRIKRARDCFVRKLRGREEKRLTQICSKRLP